MEREELERRVSEIIRNAVSAVNEILTPLEDDPKEYLAVINKMSDSMIRTATNAITPKSEKSTKPTTHDIAEIIIKLFDDEYSANPIKARRHYTGKIVHVRATMNEFEKYLKNGASPSANISPERKYMYKNVCVAIPGQVSSISELTNKEGANYEVMLRGTMSDGREWEIVSSFPKKAGRQIVPEGKSRLTLLYVFAAVVVVVAIYYFLKK